MNTNVAILKFGSSVLRGARGIRRAGDEVHDWTQRGSRVVAVVSATPGTTDRLLATIGGIARRPCPEAVATALATGEETSASLLAIALRDRKIRCVVGSAEDFRIVTAGDRLDAEPVAANVEWVVDQFGDVEVVVIPGFVGRCEQGVPSVLGRGGSDLTAIFLAQALQARECRLIKDVDGVFAWDPNDPNRDEPRHYRCLTWRDAIRHASGVVQSKAIHFAVRHRRRFTVAATKGRGTMVGANYSRLYSKG